jgi:hypothetical protein
MSYKFENTIIFNSKTNDFLVIDDFRKVIDNKLKKSKIITTNKQNKKR